MSPKGKPRCLFDLHHLKGFPFRSRLWPPSLSPWQVTEVYRKSFKSLFLTLLTAIHGELGIPPSRRCCSTGVNQNDWRIQRRYKSARTIAIVERTVCHRQAVYLPGGDSGTCHAALRRHSPEQQEHCRVYLLFRHRHSGIAT